MQVEDTPCVNPQCTSCRLELTKQITSLRALLESCQQSTEYNFGMARFYNYEYVKAKNQYHALLAEAISTTKLHEQISALTSNPDKAQVEEMFRSWGLETVTSLQAEVRRLQELMESVTYTNNVWLDTSVRNLTITCDKYRVASITDRRRIDSLLETVASLQSQLQAQSPDRDKDSEIAELRMQLEESRRSLCRHERTIAELTGQVCKETTLQKEMDQRFEGWDQFLKFVEAFCTRIDGTMAACSSAPPRGPSVPDDMLQSMHRAADGLAEAVAELDKRIPSMSTELAGAKRAFVLLEAAQEEARMMYGLLQKSEQEAESHKVEAGGLRTQVRELKNRLKEAEDVQSNLSKCSQDTVALREELDKVKKQAQADADRLRDRLSKADRELLDLRSSCKCSKYKSDLDRAKEKIVRLKEETSALKELSNTIELQKKTTEVMIRDAEKQAQIVRDLEAKNREAERRTILAERKLDIAREQHKAESKHYEDRLAGMQQTLDKLMESSSPPVAKASPEVLFTFFSVYM